MSTTRAATFGEKARYANVVLKQAPLRIKIWLGILGFATTFGPFFVIWPYWDITIVGVLNNLIAAGPGCYLLAQQGGLSRMMGIAHIQYIGIIIYVMLRCLEDGILDLSKVTGWQFWFLLCFYCPILFISWIIDVTDVFRYLCLRHREIYGIGDQLVNVDENDEIQQSTLTLTYFRE